MEILTKMKIKCWISKPYGVNLIAVALLITIVMKHLIINNNENVRRRIEAYDPMAFMNQAVYPKGLCHIYHVFSYNRRVSKRLRSNSISGITVNLLASKCF